MATTDICNENCQNIDERKPSFKPRAHILKIEWNWQSLEQLNVGEPFLGAVLQTYLMFSLRESKQIVLTRNLLYSFLCVHFSGWLVRPAPQMLFESHFHGGRTLLEAPLPCQHMTTGLVTQSFQMLFVPQSAPRKGRKRSYLIRDKRSIITIRCRATDGIGKIRFVTAYFTPVLIVPCFTEIRWCAIAGTPLRYIWELRGASERADFSNASS